MNLPLNNLTATLLAPAQATASADGGVGSNTDNVDFAQLLASVLPVDAAEMVALDVKSMVSIDENLPQTVQDNSQPSSADLSSEGSSVSVIAALLRINADEKTADVAKPDERAAAVSVSPIITPGLMAHKPAVDMLVNISQPTTADGAAKKSGSTSGAASLSLSLPLKNSTSTVLDIAASDAVKTSQTAAMLPTLAHDREPVQIKPVILPAVHGAPSPAPATYVPVAAIEYQPSVQQPVHIEIATPLRSPDWNQQLGQRVVWISNQKNQTAEIHINPPELGPIEMRLTIDSASSTQNATVQFASAHAEVRQVIETALPRLREMMAEAGISLGNASVSSESFHQRSPNYQTDATDTRESSNSHLITDQEAIITTTRRGNALLDTFA